METEMGWRTLEELKARREKVDRILGWVLLAMVIFLMGVMLALILRVAF